MDNAQILIIVFACIVVPLIIGAIFSKEKPKVEDIMVSPAPEPTPEQEEKAQVQEPVKDRGPLTEQQIKDYIAYLVYLFHESKTIFFFNNDNQSLREKEHARRLSEIREAFTSVLNKVLCLSEDQKYFHISTDEIKTILNVIIRQQNLITRTSYWVNKEDVDFFIENKDRLDSPSVIETLADINSSNISFLESAISPEKFFQEYFKFYRADVFNVLDMDGLVQIKDEQLRKQVIENLRSRADALLPKDKDQHQTVSDVLLTIRKTLLDPALHVNDVWYYCPYDFADRLVFEQFTNTRFTKAFFEGVIERARKSHIQTGKRADTIADWVVACERFIALEPDDTAWKDLAEQLWNNGICTLFALAIEHRFTNAVERVYSHAHELDDSDNPYHDFLESIPNYEMWMRFVDNKEQYDLMTEDLAFIFAKRWINNSIYSAIFKNNSLDFTKDIEPVLSPRAGERFVTRLHRVRKQYERLLEDREISKGQK